MIIYLKLLITMALWGGTFIAGRLVIQDMGAFSAAFCRFAIASLALLLLTYALEGSVLSAGSTIQWLRDELKIIRDGAHAGELAASIEDTSGVHLVPAFTGLGAPHWDSDARGAILGLQRGTTIAHIARAALESAAFQTAELLEAMSKDGVAPQTVRVDGGMSRNDWLLQFMADILRIEVVRPKNVETTVLGAAILAAVGVGEFSSLDEAAALWRLDRNFTPKMPVGERDQRLGAWKQAVARVRTQA